MANTYTLISSVTVGAGGTTTITFSSIPSTFTDLNLVLSLRSTGSTYDNVTLNFNSVTTNTYSGRELQGDGASASSSNYSSISALYGLKANSNSTSNTFSNSSVYIPNYAGSTNKSLSMDTVTENNGTTAYAVMDANLWANTSAINQITVTITANAFAQYSTAYLYGIKNS